MTTELTDEELLSRAMSILSRRRKPESLVKSLENLQKCYTPEARARLKAAQQARRKREAEQKQSKILASTS